MSRWICSCVALGALALVSAAHAADAKIEGLDKTGAPAMKSAGAMAFGPSGVLFVADPMDAALYAIGVPAPAGAKANAAMKVENIDSKLATALGLKAADITIQDIAVQPESGIVYISVSKGKLGGEPSLMMVNAAGEVSKVDLSKASYAKSSISNAPDADAKDRRGNSLRAQAITDIAFVDARVYMTGVTAGEAASTMRVVEFPFVKTDDSTSIEIYHGAHGKYETGAPIRTFVPLMFGGEPHLLAAYTCTPLVKLPISELKAKKGEKLRGTTIAELGNMNQPLDIIAYEQGKKHYLLMANSARGVMKITTDDIEKQEGITTRIAGTAGLKYETLKDQTGVEQLDKFDNTHALLLKKTASGYNLEAIELP